MIISWVIWTLNRCFFASHCQLSSYLFTGFYFLAGFCLSMRQAGHWSGILWQAVPSDLLLLCWLVGGRVAFPPNSSLLHCELIFFWIAHRFGMFFFLSWRGDIFASGCDECCRNVPQSWPTLQPRLPPSFVTVMCFLPRPGKRKKGLFWYTAAHVNTNCPLKTKLRAHFVAVAKLSLYTHLLEHCPFLWTILVE